MYAIGKRPPRVPGYRCPIDPALVTGDEKYRNILQMRRQEVVGVAYPM